MGQTTLRERLLIAAMPAKRNQNSSNALKARHCNLKGMKTLNRLIVDKLHPESGKYLPVGNSVSHNAFITTVLAQYEAQEERYGIIGGLTEAAKRCAAAAKAALECFDHAVAKEPLEMQTRITKRTFSFEWQQDAKTHKFEVGKCMEKLLAVQRKLEADCADVEALHALTLNLCSGKQDSEGLPLLMTTAKCNMFKVLAKMHHVRACTAARLFVCFKYSALF